MAARETVGAARRMDFDGMQALLGQVDALRAAIDTLAAHHLSARAAELTIVQLRYAPLSVECNVCRRKAVRIAGLHAWTGQPLVCERCAYAACDVTWCFSPAEVVIEVGRGSRVLCGRHGLVEMATLRRARIRHLPDGDGRRTLASGRALQRHSAKRVAA